MGVYAIESAQMAADVASWVESPQTNFGWIAIGAEGSAGTAKRFDSRDNVNTGARPRLVVTYTPATIPRGDLNEDGWVNVTDVFLLIEAIFGAAPSGPPNGNADGDGSVGISDVFYLINYVLAGAPAPV